MEVGDAVALADAGLLERVLANLIDNALRYAPDSIVRVNAGRVSDRILINVVDEGPPLPQRTGDQTFDAFQRPATATTPRRGTWAVGRPRFRGGDGRNDRGHRHPPGWRADGGGRPGGAPGRANDDEDQVLVIDDEPQILRALRINPSRSAATRDDHGITGGALHAAAEQQTDVIVLISACPTWTGIEVLAVCAAG